MWGIDDGVLATGSDEKAIEAVLDKVMDPQAFREKVAEIYAHPNEASQDDLLLRDGRTFD